jgi:polyhydroxyalkanoate synthesis regulator phasin
MKTLLKAGFDSIAPGSGDRLPEALTARAQALAEQVSALVGGLLEWSSEARASVRHEVKDALDRQVRDLGLATQREIDSLRARVEELERELVVARGGTKKSARKATAPKATAPKATAPKATAPKATAPKATAPKATAPKATAPKATRPKATPTRSTTTAGSARRRPGTATGAR